MMEPQTDVSSHLACKLCLSCSPHCTGDCLVLGDEILAFRFLGACPKNSSDQCEQLLLYCLPSASFVLSCAQQHTVSPRSADDCQHPTRVHGSLVNELHHVREVKSCPMNYYHNFLSVDPDNLSDNKN